MKGLFKVVLALVVIAIVYVFADRLFPKPMAQAAMTVQHALGGLHRRTVQIAGFDIAYLDSADDAARGDDAPLVLVHGIGADKDNWSQIAPFLRGTGRIVALDLPGFGESSKPLDADYSIDQQVARLAQFLDALRIPHAHLGGNSMGGAIVLAFAKAHPERVASLWLLDPAGVGSAKESEMFRAYRENGQYLLFSKTPDDFPHVMALAMSRQPLVPWSVTHELALAAAANYQLHTRIFRDLTQELPHLEQDVAGLPTPTLIVWGEQDRVLDVSGAEILHQALPNSQVVLMPGIGHMPMLEAPHQAAVDYKTFRAGLPPAAATPAVPAAAS
ncbi:alpha/beta fold hydrolase [Solimonas soli]|uniref:alpha/beta fold hydrolase n=1 Tax=Solimonas soli TaxID=413479 RepID=UPI0004B0274C|nr:alpha/beta fold hydrolase [Solimonas soli]